MSDQIDYELNGEMTYQMIIEKVLEKNPEITREVIVKIIANNRGVSELTANSKLSKYAKVCRNGEGKKVIMLRGQGDGRIPLPANVTGELSVDVNELIIQEWRDIPYIPQKMNGNTDIQVFEKMYANRNNGMYYPLLIGGTGSGKTMGVAWFCYHNKLPYERVNCNGGTTIEDLAGQFVPTDNGGFVWVNGVLTSLMLNGGVLVLDEINFCPEAILSILHPVLDHERKLCLTMKDGSTITAHPDFFVFATMNPESYHGTRPLNQALKDRFNILLYNYDKRIEKKLIPHENIRNVAESLRKRVKTGDLITPVSTRGLVQFMGNIRVFGFKTAKEMFVAKFHDDEQRAVRECIELEMERPTEKVEVDDLSIGAFFKSVDKTAGKVVNGEETEQENMFLSDEGEQLCPEYCRREFQCAHKQNIQNDVGVDVEVRCGYDRDFNNKMCSYRTDEQLIEEIDEDGSAGLKALFGE